MSKSKKYKHTSTWNNIKHKPDNVNCVAEDDDICMKIGQMWFLCQRMNGLNNIVAFRQPGKNYPVEKVMRAMFEFIYRLATEYDIEYIKIKGKPGKYGFVSRLFGDSVVLSPEREEGEEVRFAHLDKEAIKKLDTLRLCR